MGVEVLERREQTESDSEMGEFFEVTSSEAESFMRCRTFRNLEEAYTCSPSLFQASPLDPAERTSLPLDKDIGDSEECKQNASHYVRALPPSHGCRNDGDSRGTCPSPHPPYPTPNFAVKNKITCCSKHICNHS